MKSYGVEVFEVYGGMVFGGYGVIGLKDYEVECKGFLGTGLHYGETLARWG